MADAARGQAFEVVNAWLERNDGTWNTQDLIDRIAAALDRARAEALEEEAKRLRALACPRCDVGEMYAHCVALLTAAIRAAAETEGTCVRIGGCLKKINASWGCLCDHAAGCRCPEHRAAAETEGEVRRCRPGHHLPDCECWNGG